MCLSSIKSDEPIWSNIDENPQIVKSNIEHRTGKQIPRREVSSNIEQPRNNFQTWTVEHRTTELFYCFSEYLCSHWASPLTMIIVHACTIAIGHFCRGSGGRSPAVLQGVRGAQPPAKQGGLGGR